MTRDYKNARPREKQKPAIPGWLWMLTGLMIGLLVALVVYLQKQPSGNTLGDIIQQHKVETKKTTDKPKAAEKKDSGLRYEFYTLLPESEVVIPDQDVEEKAARGTTSGTKKAASYFLQAGSFRRQQEADSLKARLALIGIESSIETVTINGDTWHRIRIGPYTSIRTINQIRNRLQENELNAILVKSKG